MVAVTPDADQLAGRPGVRERIGHRLTNASPFALVSLLLALLVLFCGLYPLAKLIIGLFWVDGHFSGSAFSDAYRLPDIGKLVWQTVAVVAASATCSLLLGSVLAWLNERTDARIGIVTDAMPMVPFLLPPIAGAIGWVLLLAPSAGYANVLLRQGFGHLGWHLEQGPLNIYTWYGMIFAYMVYQVPYVFLLVSAGLRNVDGSLEEQSRICGVGPLRTMWRITLPAVRPSLAAALVLLAWDGFGQFSVPAIIGPGAHIDILAVKIVNLLSFTYPAQTQAALGLCVIVIFFVGSAWWVQSRVNRLGRNAVVGGKGVPAKRIQLGRFRWVVRSFVLGYLVISTVLPILGLLLVSLNGYWTAHIHWSKLSFSTFTHSVFHNGTTMHALKDSLTLGVIGATIGILLAVVISLFLSRRKSRAFRVLDGLIKMPAAVSHVVVGLGFILAFSASPFNLGGSLTILLLAYIVLWMPQGLVASDAAVRGVGSELVEASQIAGAGAARTFRRIYAPLILSSLVTGWVLLFVRMTGDLTASSLLAGTSNPVVGFRILDIFQNGSFAELASLALMLVAITAVVVISLLVFARRRLRSGLVQVQ